MKPFLVFSAFLAILLPSLSSGIPLQAKYQDVNIYKHELEEWLAKKDHGQTKAVVKEENSKDENEDIPKVGELFEGDIVMDDDLRNAVIGRNDKRSALRWRHKLWPNGVVPYVFAPGTDPGVRRHILKALKEFKKYTCIRVLPRTTQRSYVIIRTKPHFCSSYVGRRSPKRPQHINLGRGCYRVGTILHEFMHALGVVHEQSRPDRDRFVEVIWPNIRKGEGHNFKKYDYSKVGSYGVRYNFNSIMHYGPHAFSRNGERTLEAKGKKDLRFGQRIQFSVGDVQIINRLYKCKIKYDPFELIASNDGSRSDDDLYDNIEEGR